MKLLFIKFSLKLWGISHARGSRYFDLELGRPVLRRPG
jgi:hypothetical protein